MIFVNIACYRDPECEATVRDLFNKARRPGEIVVCVVMQTEPKDNILFFGRNVRMLVVKGSDSQGVCWARSMGYKFWDGEDYVLQVDSHMRFAEHWDVKMLRQLERCGVSKALLTTYPPAYEPPNTLLDHRTPFLAAVRFEPNGVLVQRGYIHDTAPVLPRPSAFVAAGFIFGRSQWIRDVPYDRRLYFWGEETTTAVRLWTHGWDMFGPTEPLLWHWYNRANGRVPWQDDPEWHVRDGLSLARMRHLLGIEAAATSEAIVDIERYGFGSVRTFAQYQAFAGINFRERTIAPHALAGEWPYTTPDPCNRASVSASTPQSVANTSSVCSPNSGGREILAGESDNLIGQPTV
ncbi:MAG TPA: GlcNAc-transferase family protein [Rhodopila sp.]